MKEFWLPYGDTELPVLIENEELYKVLSPKNLEENKNTVAQANLSLKDYIEKLFSEKEIKKAVLIAPKESIQTNLINELMSIIKEELFNKGLKKEDLNIIRFPNFEEFFFKRGLTNNEMETFNEVYHNPLNNEASFVKETNLGVKFFLNKIFEEADAKILIGDVYSSFLFNFFNPFLQAIFGLSGEKTIIELLKFIALNIDSFYHNVYAAEKIIEEFKNIFLIDLALTLVPNVKGEAANIILGSLNETLNKEKEFIEALKFKVENKAGLTIGSAGGSFFDSNFLKALPGLKNLSNISEEESAVVYLAECRNGLGFNPKLKRAKEKNEENIFSIFECLIQEIINKILEKTKIYLISSLPNYYAREILGFKPCETLNLALKNVKLNFKNEKNILIIPYASYTILELKNNAR